MYAWYCITHPVATNLLPLDLLTGDRKLSSQTLEGTLIEFCESLVNFCLVALLELCDVANGVAGVGDGNWLGSLETDVAVFVVVDIDVDGA